MLKRPNTSPPMFRNQRRPNAIDDDHVPFRKKGVCVCAKNLLLTECISLILKKILKDRSVHGKADEQRISR